MASILVVEDNQDMRKAVKAFFLREGFKVVDVASTEDGIDAVDENHFDIALIDINLPGKSGFDMAEYIRGSYDDMPLIALTARDSLDDKLKGFNIGFSDYVAKPFNLEEVLARVRAQLKNNYSDQEVIQTGKLKIDPRSMKFWVNSKEIELTQLEFRLIHILMRNAGVLVKIDDAIEYSWGEQSDLVDPPIRVHIAHLRKKIGDNDYTLIKTIPGTGYILND